ncbi:2'-5' RNA ligase family protein [Nocardioides terrisoli]|uniref:2'-5' RNA ligase family protein n=1 Tax=Nocardioides terrisoli TaxID=3388267 RepID=UPI00287B745F|nr:2'-5' RNA ligase family protein [Nocardioides marmorisolisilvae]
MTATDLPAITGIVLMVEEARHLAPHAHITLLAPFGRDNRPSREEIAEVERFFADITPFDFVLNGDSRFPEGARYLSPEPAGIFTRLTHGLHQLFPEYPPYEGRFDLVVPHLTIPDDVPAPGEPLAAHAREAALLHFHGEFTELATFPFGTSAA